MSYLAKTVRSLKIAALTGIAALAISGCKPKNDIYIGRLTESEVTVTVVKTDIKEFSAACDSTTHERALVHYHDSATDKLERQFFCEDGVPHGSVIIWHPNGQQYLEGTLIKGEVDGVVTRWHDNGKLSENGVYQNGVPVGNHKQYDISGKLVKEVNYPTD